MHELHTVFKSIQNGYISVVVGNPEQKGLVVDGFFSVTDLDAASQRMKELSKNKNAYYSFNVLGSIPSDGRGKSDDFVTSPGLFLDFDLRQGDIGIHAADDNLPKSIDEVFELLDEEGLPLPTQVIKSGNGFYGQYLFKEPYTFNSTSERSTFVELRRVFQQRFTSAFKERGLTLDNMADLPRITRMSGTLNHKTTPPKLVEFVSYDEDLRIDFDWFRQFSADRSSSGTKVAILSGRGVRRNIHDVRAENKDVPNLVSVVGGCRWARSAIDRMSCLPYPEWFSLAGIIKHCADGEDIFHDLSSKDPRYNQDEAQTLFKDIKGPTTCRHIAENGGGAHCFSCPASANQHVKSPLAFGTEIPHLAAALGAHVFALKRELFKDTLTGEELSKVNFADRYLKHFKSPVGTMLSNKRLLQVVSTTYLPGEHEIFVPTGAGAFLLNIWKPGDLMPVEGDVGIILRHLEFLIPVEAERKHFIDVLAHAVQKPGVKIDHVILLIGGQGTGKSWLHLFAQRLFGEENIVLVDNETLASHFNARMGNKQVAILEEVGQEDRADAYNRLKLWITEDKVIAEEKHQPRYAVSTPRFMLAFSNREVPIKVEPGDRRFMFIDSPKVALAADYYEILFKDGLDQAGAFLRLLIERDIRNFSPKSRPPKTELGARIAGASKPAAEAEIAAMIKEGDAPFDQEHFTLASVIGSLKGRLNSRANCSGVEVSRVLRLFGFESVNAGQIRVANRAYRLWASSSSKWMSASAAEIREEIMKNPLI